MPSVCPLPTDSTNPACQKAKCVALPEPTLSFSLPCRWQDGFAFTPLLNISFQKFIPWIALVLLVYIGGKMIYEDIRGDEGDGSGSACSILGFGTLVIQGIATSIDALSVGFTIAEYSLGFALTAGIIIAVVTFAISFSGLVVGKKAGGRFSYKAEILGGIILIGIGFEIFIKGLFF